jgi:hypothetical protein
MISCRTSFFAWVHESILIFPALNFLRCLVVCRFKSSGRVLTDLRLCLR